jgi:hypothetical protein
MITVEVSDIIMSESKVTMTDAMSDDDMYESESSGVAMAPQLDDDIQAQHETTIDLSGEDKASSGGGRPQLEALGPTSTPRAYQLEMLEESLRRNIIVAVSCLTQD